MKRQRHIQTHILLTLIGLTAAILLAVGLSFNLAVRGYTKERTASTASGLPSPSPSRRRTMVR